MPWQKRVADFLTLTRAPLAVALIWLGVTQERNGIEAAWALLLTAATVDTMDGYFARIAPGSHKTWVGSNDLLFDVLFSTALLAYLVLAGYVALLLAAAYLALWAVIVFTTSGYANVRAVLFQGPIYLITVFAAARADSRVYGWTAIWLVIMLLFAGRRFLNVRLPALLRDFFATVHRLSRRHKKS